MLLRLRATTTSPLIMLIDYLQTHEQLGAQMRNYQEQDQDHINARHELQKEYRRAVDQFADSLHKLKKDVSKLQEEKTQLQLKLDETAMHLDSANFKVESLQLTNNSVCNSVSNSEWEKKRTQNEAADMTALRSDLLAANKRRDQLEAEVRFACVSSCVVACQHNGCLCSVLRIRISITSIGSLSLSLL